MNDDEIRSQLERRASSASSASSRPDWVRRDLLPAVWREDDTRPQRVMTSNWSPRLGVVAVVVALLILVIAVPRIVPQLPTSSASPSESPSPTDATILSTAQFAADLAAGRLLGQTVLVQGRISFNATFRRARTPPCLPPDGLCELGGLEGTGVTIDARYTATTYAPASGTWIRSDDGRDYHFPSVPIEGVLAMRVATEHGVEFIGLARQDGETPIRSVAQAQALDISSFTSDEVVLVRGWLVESEPPGTQINIDCIMPPFPRVEGLPYNYCQPQDYLSSEEVVGRDLPSGDAAHLSVQRNAAQLFGGQGQDGTALFAIAPRLYGGCFGTPTCWQWEVVARIDEATRLPAASPGPLISPTPPADTPSPTPLSQGTTAVDCATPEEFANEAISIIDHSGRIGGCSVAHSDVIPEGNVGLSTTGLPNQLAVDWKVNTACPGNFAMEFWGPIVMPDSYDIYGLRIARTGLSGATCTGETEVRRVEIAFTESVKPYQIQAFVADEFQSVNSNSSSVTATTDEGIFALSLGTPLSGFQANEAIVIRALLTYNGPTGSVTISGGFLEFWLASLTGGPVLSRYASDLMCPHSETQFSNGGSIGSEFPMPQPPALSDPNRAFYDQYVSDGLLRLPAGTYLFAVSSYFNTGTGCSGENVSLHTAIAVLVH